MSYRVEIAPTNRAGCSATHCKKEGTKIQKGDIRQGVMVTIQEHQSWKWRHWGCVTPEVLNNWKEVTGMDMDLMDGYDTLPADAQEKVQRALNQVHVDDEDWMGDLECNRFDPDKKNRGMFVKTPKKKAKDDDDDDDEREASPVKKKATKKRGRAKEDDVEDEAKPAAKKTKGKPKKAVKDEDDDIEPEEAAPVKKTSKGKKANDEAAEATKTAPTTKKPNTKKAKSAAKVDSDEVQEPTEEEKPAPAKKSRTKKGTAKTVVATDESTEPKPQPQKRQGRSKKSAPAGED